MTHPPQPSDPVAAWKALCPLSLQADCHIRLQPQLAPPNMEEYTNSLLAAVLPSVLNKFRIYLTLLRFLDYSISDEITKVGLGQNTGFPRVESDRRIDSRVL